MDVIDFSAARQRRLAAMARTKAGPQARFAAMQEALSQDELTAMGRIVQQHALRLAYRIVAASPVWGKPEEAEPLRVWTELEAVVPVLADLIMAESYMPAAVRMAGTHLTANEVGLWAARRMVLDYLLILIDDNSRPDDWLDIRDREPLRNVCAYLGYAMD